jgi:hypothetical protein
MKTLLRELFHFARRTSQAPLSQYVEGVQIYGTKQQRRPFEELTSQGLQRKISLEERADE